ncbi:MAG: hypothetical protein C5B55_04375 [Blastocatellia bacterium]|nr:MAG: hypothetical protein C5B55_04375 [Blastocatellia bacterium]
MFRGFAALVAESPWLSTGFAKKQATPNSGGASTANFGIGKPKAFRNERGKAAVPEQKSSRTQVIL